MKCVTKFFKLSVYSYRSTTVIWWKKETFKQWKIKTEISKEPFRYLTLACECRHVTNEFSQKKTNE